ncbi:MAG TPA: ATP-binding cassette domain-containing protein [Ferrovibrio sp.]|uniref:ABC transporter ATP-binding protein n=1 Tax=Ferrovibrio sp. TaxID=1917215 RepID=UPI002ECFEE60
MTGFRLRGISCGFAAPDGHKILRGVDLNVAPGEFVSLVGPSGAGKTTLLRIIAGLNIHYSGRIDWPQGAPRRLGFVFQEPRLVPWRTVLDNLLLIAPPGSQTAALDLLAAVELASCAEAFPGQLSGGMQRRVAFARALLSKPDLLLLDEPFLSLDAPLAGRLHELLNAYWQKHRPTTLLVTHDLNEAAFLSNRVVVISPHEGRLIAERILPPPNERLGAESAVRKAVAELRQTAKSCLNLNGPAIP